MNKLDPSHYKEARAMCKALIQNRHRVTRLVERSVHPCYREPLLAQTTLKPKGWKFESHEGIVMETRGLQDEINVKLVVPAATDEVLVAAAKLGDHSAFAELWTRHSNTAFKMAYRIMGNRDDAEDVIQDAWMKAYVHLKTFDGRAKCSTWLTRITINSALMTLRKKRAHRETRMEVTDGETWQYWEITDQTKDVEEFYAGNERIEHLRQAICLLRPSLRNVVEIHQLNDRSVKEIAELAGLSFAATKSRLRRARIILRRALG